jgi:beta-1,4-mannosyl-glycoprotein beta-1,4-N-acetylglucosaminyltransferase
LVFPANQDRFERWLHKIRYVQVEFPKGLKPWGRENYQRDALGWGLQGLQPDDLIVVCDVDEILRAEVIQQFRDGQLHVPSTLSFPIHPYRLDWKWDDLEDGFGRTTVISGSQLQQQPDGSWFGVQHAVAPTLVQHKHDFPEYTHLVGEFGWHFTYQGSEANIVRKSYSIADDWVKGLATVETAAHAIRTGADVYGRQHRTSSRVPLSDLPRYVQDNPGKFAHMIGATQ